MTTHASRICLSAANFHFTGHCICELKKNCVSCWANEVRLGSSEKMSRDSSNSLAVHNLQRFRCSKERMWLTNGQHMQEKLPHRLAALSVREEWHSTKSSKRLQSPDLLQVQDKHCKLLLFSFSFFLSTDFPCDNEEEKRVQHLHDEHTYCSKFKKTDDALCWFLLRSTFYNFAKIAHER